MPLLARRAASATERTLVYFRMNMYIRPPMRLSSSPTHQSISGRCWTRAYFRDGSFTTELGILRGVRFTSVSNRTADIVAGPVRAKFGSRCFHSNTSSARASSVGGTVSPSALAVLRLRVSSNLVGCSMGSSAGLTPLRILSIKLAARKYRSG
jgi:hypothetical protein